jgi:hypothetical protein
MVSAPSFSAALVRKRLEYVVSSIMVLQVTSETLAKLGMK